MKRPLLSAGIIAAVMMLAPVSRAGEQDFAIVNKTGTTLTNIYVSHVSQRSWGKDLLKGQELDSGETFNVTFNGYGDDECTFDIRVESAKTYWEIPKVNLCDIEKLTLTKKGNQLNYKTE